MRSVMVAALVSLSAAVSSAQYAFVDIGDVDATSFAFARDGAFLEPGVFSADQPNGFDIVTAFDDDSLSVSFDRIVIGGSDSNFYGFDFGQAVTLTDIFLLEFNYGEAGWGLFVDGSPLTSYSGTVSDVGPLQSPEAGGNVPGPGVVAPFLLAASGLFCRRRI